MLKEIVAIYVIIAQIWTSFCSPGVSPFLGKVYDFDSKFPIEEFHNGWAKWVYWNHIWKGKREGLPSLHWNDDHNCDCPFELECFNDEHCTDSPRVICGMTVCCGTRCEQPPDQEKPLWQFMKEQCQEYCKQPDAVKEKCQECKDEWKEAKEEWKEENKGKSIVEFSNEQDDKTDDEDGITGNSNRTLDKSDRNDP